MSYFAEAFSAAFTLILSFDPEVYAIAWTSLRVSVMAVMVAAVPALPLGLVVALHEFRGRATLLWVLSTLMALPTVVVGLLLYGMLSRRGPLGELGILYTPTAIVIGEAVLILPILLNLTITAVRSTDPRLHLTCRSLGAGPLQQALIYANEARLGLLAALVAGFGRAVGEVGVAMMLGGNIEGFTRTMTTAIALETSKGEFALGLALGVLLLIVAFAVNGALQALGRFRA